MIKVTIGTTTERSTAIVEPSAVIKDVLEEKEIMWEAANVHMNGSQLMPASINKSFADLGIEDDTEVRLIAVVKTNNA